MVIKGTLINVNTEQLQDLVLGNLLEKQTFWLLLTIQKQEKSKGKLFFKFFKKQLKSSLSANPS